MPRLKTDKIRIIKDPTVTPTSVNLNRENMAELEAVRGSFKAMLNVEPSRSAIIRRALRVYTCHMMNQVIQNAGNPAEKLAKFNTEIEQIRKLANNEFYEG